MNKALNTQKGVEALKTSHDQRLYQQKIDILDKQIDQLVYELYELTPEEIKVVEGA